MLKVSPNPSNASDLASEYSSREERSIRCNRLGMSFEAVCEAGLSIDKAMRSFPFELLSHEARLVLQLLNNKSLIIKDAWLSSRLSNRAFHELLKRLEGNGIIHVAASETDRRTKSIALDPQFVEHFSRQWDVFGKTNPQ